MARESEKMTRVREARSALLTTHPFFGVLSLKLALVEDATVSTARVDTTRIRFNPAFIESLSNAELKAVIAHEVMHLGMLHHAREGNRDHAMWETACDYAINPALILDGFALPKGALFDFRFDGMAAESIYQTLRDEQPPEPPKADPNGKPQQDNGGQDGAQSPGEGQPDATGKPSQGAGEPATGSFDSAGPEDSADAGEAAREWQENANEAMRAAASAGKLPAGIKRVVSDAIVAKADWKALLRRFMTDQIKTRATWNTPNKRFPDIFLPGKIKDGMGPLVIGVDTSGSISQAALDRFSAEISAIAADVEPAAIHVVYCDAEVQHIDVYEPGEVIRLSPHGGGGTRFKPVFEHVDAQGLQPAALVYLTDLDCHEWPQEPGYPVLWAGYDSGGRQAPMGETVTID